jgi:hypothetical protein
VYDFGDWPENFIFLTSRALDDMLLVVEFGIIPNSELIKNIKWRFAW